MEIFNFSCQQKFGHPDSIHFHYPDLTSSPYFKKKSPSQLRRQERRKKEAEAKAGEALSTSKHTEIVIHVTDSSQVDPKEALENSNLTEKSIPPSIAFKCDQCDF